ncbi:MAG: nucleoside triphosphate pyrophosphatase [Ilumatobacteraceae bacterium]
MVEAEPKIVLASRSPRRIELLTQFLAPLHLTFDTVPADIDETPLRGETPEEYVRRCAVEKSSVVAKRLHEANPIADFVVIGADTTVDLDGRIFGQPNDITEAADMLRRLSGRMHRVWTAVSIRRGNQHADGVDSAMVIMVPITEDLLTWYLDRGESLGKAGAYAAQGEGKRLVERIDGNLETVIGLPLGLVAELASRVGASWNLGS